MSVEEPVIDPDDWITLTPSELASIRRAINRVDPATSGFFVGGDGPLRVMEDADCEPTLWDVKGIAMTRRCDVGDEVWELLLRLLGDSE